MHNGNVRRTSVGICSLVSRHRCALRSAFLLGLMLLAAPLCAEEWLDFSTPAVGRGGTGMATRSATGAYYNPANAARRPWEDSILKLEFDLPVTVTAGLHGQSYRLMFDTVDLANELFDRFESGAFDSGGGVDSDDMLFALRVFERLDNLTSLNGDGLYVTSSIGLGVNFAGGIGLPRDGFSAYLGGFGIAAASPVVDLQSLRGYRLADEAGAQWEALVNEAIINSGGTAPTPESAAAQQFSADLQAGGYSPATADALAAWAEDANVSFGGEAADILLDFLINTYDGNGESLESGANPLAGNNSGFLIRGLAWYELGLSYGAGVPVMGMSDWLTFGVTLKFMQAYAYSELLRVEDMTSNGIEDTLSRLGEKISDAYSLEADAARFNVGLDIGLVFTPQIGPVNTLAISLTARNINGPEFRWEPSTRTAGEPTLVRFDPQFRLGASYIFFDTLNLPLTVAFELDLNKVSSDIMPRYHHQFFRMGAAWEPQFGGFGFGLRLGGFKNIADANETFTMTAGLGLRAFFFYLDVGGHMSFENREFGTSVDFEPVPQRAGLSVQLGFNFEF